MKERAPSAENWENTEWKLLACFYVASALALTAGMYLTAGQEIPHTKEMIDVGIDITIAGTAGLIGSSIFFLSKIAEGS